MDWVRLLREEGRYNSLIRLDELAQKHSIAPTAVRKALKRCEDRGLVEHIASKLYVNELAPEFSPRDLVNVLRSQSYISLESALADYGVTTQRPVILTCVTTGKPQEFRSKSFAIVYRGINQRLYWGFRERQTRYGNFKIAEAEKALLDWVYLSLRGGILPALDELDFTGISRSKLLSYADKYPTTVLRFLLPTLARAPFAA
jgi:predicted transcriptional regulator of viral defense system